MQHLIDYEIRNYYFSRQSFIVFTPPILEPEVMRRARARYYPDEEAYDSMDIEAAIWSKEANWIDATYDDLEPEDEDEACVYYEKFWDSMELFWEEVTDENI